jgi:hypothetical protein
MPHREDAAVKPVQAPAGDPMRDGPAIEAERGQLGAGYDPVLPRRQGTDSLVRRSRLQFCTQVVLNRTLDRHAHIVAARASRICTETQRFSGVQSPRSRSPAPPRSQTADSLVQRSRLQFCTHVV